jgi:hypothetical protein
LLLETMDAMLTLHLDLQRISDEQQPMSMDGLPALHPDLQRIVDEQQPMSMDVLPAFHPDLQQVVDKQHATSTSAPPPAVQSKLLFPPVLPLSASTGTATACGTEPRPAPPPAAPTATTTAIRGLELPPAQPSSALMVAAAATYGPPPRPAQLPAPPTASTTTFGGIENLPPPSCAPKAAILCTVSIPTSSPTLWFVAATSLYKPALFAWDLGVRDIRRRCLDHKEGLMSIYRHHEVCNIFGCQE